MAGDAIRMNPVHSSIESLSRMKESGPTLLDANVYATKKTIAQGMLDVALLTANASQLKYLLQLGKEQQFFHLMVTLISLSIILQVIVGCLFVTMGYIDLNEPRRQRKLNMINNIATVAVFFITIVNILIAGFGINSSGPHK